MSRWRPPQPKAKPYITPAGFAALEVEMKTLWQRRREVVRHLAAAAAEGDRSENAEYQYRKKELRELDRRIGYLKRRMPALTIVRDVPDRRDKVFFGARVSLENDAGVLRQVRIVGADEANAEAGLISVDSPVAERLLGAMLDAAVVLPDDSRWFIVEIEYPVSDSTG